MAKRNPIRRRLYLCVTFGLAAFLSDRDTKSFDKSLRSIFESILLFITDNEMKRPVEYGLSELIRAFNLPGCLECMIYQLSLYQTCRMLVIKDIMHDVRDISRLRKGH